MGRELEYKLSVSDKKILEDILHDPKIGELAEAWAQTKMKTTYYDTPDRLLSSRHITLRRRFEGEKSIVCVKIPLKQAHLRGEWQIEAEQVDEESIVRLVALGAPKELVYFSSRCELVATCGAEFLRRHAMLQFSDGSRAELALDCGFLHGQTQKFSFSEAELELYEGEPTQMLTLVQYLCEKYAISEEPMSKYARARRLK